MAMSFIGRTLITKTNPNSVLPSIISRSFTTNSLSVPSSSPLLRLRSLISLTQLSLSPSISSSFIGLKYFSTRQATSSLNDPSPNWSNRPPKETILLDGCDFEHWLIVVEKPEGEPTRDEIIDSYIKSDAKVIGSEDEARKQIYSVSTRHYFAFGVIVSEEASNKFKELPGFCWVLPDSYLNVKEKDYRGEPFVNGVAVPYDPKYHEEWVRNNARANERSRRNDRPRNFDRSRNFEKRRENMQSRDSQPPPPPGGNRPGPNMGGGSPPPQNMQNPGPNMGGGGPPLNAPNYAGMAPQNAPNYQGPPPPQNAQHYGGPPPLPPPPQNAQHYGPPPTQNAPYGGGMPQQNQNYAGMPQQNQNYTGMPPNRPNPGYANNMPNQGNQQGCNFQYGPNSGGMPYQNRDGPPPTTPNRDYQNSYAPPSGNGGMPENNAYQVRDILGRDTDF